MIATVFNQLWRLIKLEVTETEATFEEKLIKEE